ncbi:MAG: hypothetical protein WCJ58_04405 [bacterium]
MSYQEKRTIVNIVSGTLIIVAYCIYAFTKYQSGTIVSDDLKFWASTMLVFISLGIVIMIITQIIYHILLAIAVAVKNRETDEKKINSTLEASLIEDEMDKLIELKSTKFGYIFIGIGFVGGLITLVLNYPQFVMLNIMFLSFSLGSLIEGFINLYYYRKGV